MERKTVWRKSASFTAYKLASLKPSVRVLNDSLLSSSHAKQSKPRLYIYIYLMNKIINYFPSSSSSLHRTFETEKPFLRNLPLQ